MKKRLSRKTMRRKNILKRKTMRRKNILKRKTMRRKNTLRRKNIKKRGGKPINMINRNLELKNCKSYFSIGNHNHDYNLSTYNHIDNITYDGNQVKTYYILKIKVGDNYYTATKSYSELFSDCNKLFSGYPLLGEEMKRILKQNFSKFMNNTKCLERVKAIEDALDYLQIQIWYLQTERKIEEKLTSNGWEKQL